MKNIIKISKDSLERIKLNEAKRTELINKSKSADNYSITNQSRGKNRYERRKYSKVASSVRQYKNLDMDAFFKRDVLTVNIEVQGETNDYIVTVRMTGVLKEVLKQFEQSGDMKLNAKILNKALIKVFNSSDLQIKCSCPDGKYRHNYWQWKNNYGVQYEPRPSDITNPNDTKGSGCKHTMLVLSNVTWLIKVSSVIVNYIRYCQEHLQKNYAEYIFPKLYGMPYKKAVQLHLFNNGWFPQDQQTMSAIINKGLQGRDEKGRFIKKINPNEEPKQQIGNKPVQQQFEFDDVDDDTKKVLGYKKPDKPKAMSLFRDYDDNGNVIGQGEDIPEPKPKHPTVKSLSNKAPTNKSIKKPVVSNGQLSFNFDDEEDNN